MTLFETQLIDASFATNQSIYRACVVLIKNVELLVDLMPLDIAHFDIILGMDWDVG